ncbi:MAG: histidine ammonia-lyase [Sphingobacteriaceae bacterium]|nr:histidine ammonia-lyase [Sphingobacteriaceae bacterium]
MLFLINHNNRITIEEVEKFLTDESAEVRLAEETILEVKKGRDYLEAKLKSSKEPVYGINTGFGSLCNVIIPDNELGQLQENLVKSHACGTGKEVPLPVIKLMLFLKVRSLCYGKSGVKPETVNLLCELINHQIYPVIFQQGSLGASGDLAPLAHLSLPLLGLGKVNYKGEIISAADAFKKVGLKTIKLGAKEGLALLNGTQFMSAYGVYNIIQSKHLNKIADAIASVSLDAFYSKYDPFKANLHTIRAHAGQIETADSILSWLAGSEIGKLSKKQVQDPYSFRCIPQVHGATKDTLKFVTSVFETEINSVTDNPTIFPDSDEILSGGNFHGQPLALASDYLAIAMAELGSISERRIYLLISGQRELPAFLTKHPGLHSGFMIPQYTAAGIVSQNKQLCTPASVDSIVSSNGQEDHVSMGANAATKCYEVIQNIETILAIELMNAAQAIEFRKPIKSSVKIEKFLGSYRKTVPFVEYDEILHNLILLSKNFVAHVKL